MKMRGRLIFFIILLLLSGVGYLLFLKPDFSETGTIIYNPIEGGFYGIKGDSGNFYEPINLGKEYHKDGLRVKFKARYLKDYASIHMSGKIIKIINIEKIE